MDKAKQEYTTWQYKAGGLMKGMGPFLAVLLLVGAARGQEADDPLTVRTKKGLVQGITQQSATGSSVDAFLGIPYAQPPTGKNRFRHPRPVDPWKGIMMAKELPSSCYQIKDTTYGGFPGSVMWEPNTPLNEDCLKINVWTPNPRGENLTVMVWIFGGGFYSGTSSLDVYDAKILAGDMNVIVVSMNYRVASLGFLYFGIPEAPGNAGLFDQLMALEWVRENIHYFGGNPKQITLFGESAGAVSIGHHLLSPLSSHLFDKAILQSGSATSPWGVTTREHSMQQGMRLAKALGCPHDINKPEEVVACLSEKDASDLVSNEWSNNGVVDFPFVPVVDGAFFLEHPKDAMKNGFFKKTKLMVGNTRDEATFFLVYFLPQYLFLNDSVRITRKNLTDIMPKLFPTIPPLGIRAIQHEYTNWADPDDPPSNLEAMDRMTGDCHFTCPVIHFAHTYASAGLPVYYFLFSQRYSTNPWPRWMGTIHGDEIVFIFGEPIYKPGFTEAERNFSRRIMAYWTNFAKTG
ncbi:BCHE [Cordylochernes scorpioides]|uniref:Carboxylic ester hydrolase n=1 Tax=Cordylochernes scorpioides TaxID=51811 RepID=A0ABY6LH55_9ARAC|nr:BCHE [Cordylochernes scorpioides]